MTLGSQRCRVTLLLLIVAVVAAGVSSADAANTVLRFDIGFADLWASVYVRLLDTEAPGTVANFLTYVNAGDYDQSFFHRLVPGFVLQGGGFSWDYDLQELVSLPRRDPIENEFGRTNERGALAMAKLGGDPDSATNGFFFNLGDNNDPGDPNSLDVQNGGFTVFAYVIGDGMGTVDILANPLTSPYEIVIDNGAPPLGDLPLVFYDGGYYLETLFEVSVHDVDGDADFDGDVDDDDYNEFMAEFGYSGLGLAADFDGDYDVDLDDLAVLRANYAGGVSPLPAPAPEPGSMCLLGLCGMALIRKRRGRS